METNIAVALCGTTLCAIAGAFVFARWNKLGLQELFIVTVGLYFGAYSVVDSLVNDLRGFDSSIVLLLFSIIIVSTMPVLYLSHLLPKTVSYQLRLDTIRNDWINVPTVPVLASSAIIIAYRLYTYVFFSEFSALEGQELEKLDVSLPYWYTTFGLIAQSVAFAVTPVAFVKSLRSPGIIKLLWWLLIAVLLVMTFGFGRRALIAVLTIFVWLGLRGSKTASQKWRLILACVVLVPVLLVLNNVYQAYRLASHRGVVLTNLQMEDAEEIFTKQNPLTIALDFDRTTTNLEERTAMWQFNYQLLGSALYRSVEYSYGMLLIQEAGNFIPRIVYPDKVIFDVDFEVSRAFGIQERDWPSNILAFAFADFGIAALIAIPLMMVSLLALFGYAQHMIKDTFLRVMLAGFIISYVLNLEVTYAVPLQLARDFLLVAIVYWALRLLFGGRALRAGSSAGGRLP